MSVQNGNTVAVHYRGTLEDGEQFDSSYDRGEPLAYQAGTGEMIPGFDAAVTGMEVGEKKTFTLEPTEAYGEKNPAAVQEVPRAMFGEGANLAVGTIVQGQNENGQTMMATVMAITEDTVTVDLNHPMAGKSLTFDVEVVSIT